MEKNPAKISGAPLMASAPTTYVQPVMGILRISPPIFCMSCSWCMAWITEPEQRKSRALKKAWVITWKMPTMNAPTPMAMNMYPNWLTVE